MRLPRSVVPEQHQPLEAGPLQSLGFGSLPALSEDAGGAMGCLGAVLGRPSTRGRVGDKVLECLAPQRSQVAALLEPPQASLLQKLLGARAGDHTPEPRIVDRDVGPQVAGSAAQRTGIRSR